MKKHRIFRLFLAIAAASNFGTISEATAARPDTIAARMRGELREVVVTAQEARSATSASVIDSTAMKHLQPTSFTDLLELLPGNITKDPDMGQVNSIALRQAANASTEDTDYATSALGTLFVLDGMPVNTNAQMQTSPDANQSGRMSIGRGVDMRRISTDDIEQVEIVRGIPSVEYGELTSGMVKIKRKSSAGRWEARFKADNQSRLLYAGKGFALGSNYRIINASVSWLDAKIDPRNNRENYQRLGATLRTDFRWHNTALDIHWNSALDYTGTFEADNNDPDLTVNNTIDRFSKRDHSLSWNNTLQFTPVADRFFKEANLAVGLTGALEHLAQQKHVASSRIMPMPVSTVAGSNYVGYLPMLYLADFDVYGRPVTAMAKASARFRHTAHRFIASLKAGAEWNMSKNFGRGEVYDIARPLVAGNNTRPRPFSAVPAMNQLSAYAETELKWLPGNFVFDLTAGARVTSLVGMDSRYLLNLHPYIDPRINARVVFPLPDLAGYPLRLELDGGIGQHTKMPVAAYLYPNLVYTDLVQLNYYHNEPRYRTMNVMTFIDDVTNYDLRAARNLKWEVRGDISYRGNRLSVTYFRENMNDGFRSASEVRRYLYRRYDASAFDPYAADAAPAIELLPYSDAVFQTTGRRVTNGSRTAKSGVEFTFQSRRITALRTRLTVTGAWLQTENYNSDPLWYKPTIIVGGTELPYIGLYDDRDGSRYESCNTNFLIDTDLPRLKLNFSISIQNMWYTSRRTLYRDGVPTHYIDLDGTLREFTAESLSDPYLAQLVRRYSATAFDRQTVPVATTVNLKATKSFWGERIGLALYVNRLFAILPDYERYGVTMRRFSSPYFGMEINLKL